MRVLCQTIFNTAEKSDLRLFKYKVSTRSKSKGDKLDTQYNYRLLFQRQ